MFLGVIDVVIPLAVQYLLVDIPSPPPACKLRYKEMVVVVADVIDVVIVYHLLCSIY